MFNTNNPYTLRTDIIEGIPRYFVSFEDGQAIQRETEVSRPVYLEFLKFVRVERNLQRSDERNIEQLELSDESLYNRALSQPKSVEDSAFDSLRNENLRTAIHQLPETQRRRFVLYHEFGLTYQQIAEIEGCTHVAVIHSLNKAKKFIKNFLD